VYTSKGLIERIAKHKKFDPQGGWFPDRRDVGGFGEDLSFCEQAMRVKTQLYVNTAIQLGHSGDPYVVTQADFQRLKAARKVEAEEVANNDGWGYK